MMQKWIIIFTILSSLLFTNQISARDQTVTERNHSQPEIDRPPMEWTLSEILEMAYQHSPARQSFTAERNAAYSEASQGIAYPNPVIETLIGKNSIYGEEESTYQTLEIAFNQALEFPLKRASRKAALATTESIGDAEEGVYHLDMGHQISREFFTILFHSAAISLAMELVQMEQEIERIVTERVSSGDAPEIDRIKVQIETLKASQNLQTHQQMLNTCRKRLNTFCGNTLPSDFILEDILAMIPEPILPDEAPPADAQHPWLRRGSAVVQHREQILKSEYLDRIPDVNLGVQYTREPDFKTIGASIGVSIPIWDRNRDGIKAARSELVRAKAEQKQVLLEISRDYSIALENFKSALALVSTYRNQLRSASHEALRIETFRYQEGETDFIQLQEALRTARQSEMDYLQSLYDAQLARLDLIRAIGTGDFAYDKISDR